MKCNIDARGKAWRLRTGGLFLLIGIVLAALTLLGVTGGRSMWAVSIGFAVLGIVGIIEGRAGWCVVRAMGIKTPV